MWPLARATVLESLDWRSLMSLWPALLAGRRELHPLTFIVALPDDAVPAVTVQFDATQALGCGAILTMAVRARQWQPVIASGGV
jgi:hypothetical protein